MKRFSLRYCLLVVAFLALAGWLAVAYADIRLAARSQSLIDKAHMGYLQQVGAGDELWRWRAFGVEADVCKALTGTLGWPWLRRHSHSLDWPGMLAASAASGRCERGGNNSVIFSATAG